MGTAGSCRNGEGDSVWVRTGVRQSGKGRELRLLINGGLNR